jgi:hypothetical protein
MFKDAETQPYRNFKNFLDTIIKMPEDLKNRLANEFERRRLEVPVVEAPVVEALDQTPKLVAKKMKTKKSVPTTEVPAVEVPKPEVPAVEVPAITAPIRKKSTLTSKSKNTKNEDKSEPIASKVPAMHVIVESRETMEPDTLIKMKTIRKKIVVSNPDTNVIDTPASSSVVAHALTLNHECDVPRKIIKKKTNAISSVQ